MRVEFLDADGTELLIEERSDISDLLSIFKNGGKFNYYESEDYFFHGTLDDIIFCIEPDPKVEDNMNMIDVLKLYFTKDGDMSSK